MGGCRCTFRDCENGTASRKELHFFRYPVRDPERLMEWARNADRLEFVDLPYDKVSNKVVCQEHFERKMFMNDLRDRLTKMAIPRLMPRPDETILNVETGLIHAEGDCSSSMKDDMIEPVRSSSPQSTMKIQQIEVEQVVRRSSVESPAKKIKILNSQTLALNSNATACEVIRIKTSSATNGRERLQKLLNRNVISLHSQTRPRKMKAKLLNEENGELILSDQDMNEVDIYTQDGIQLSNLRGESSSSSASTSLANNQQHDIPNSTVGNANQAAPEPVTVPVIDPGLSEKMDHNIREIEELKKLVQDLANRPEPNVPIAAVPEKMVMERGPQLTKAQLFNSIKRYLNPSMVTLLRMELFAGSAERQWKPDEKSLAVDMINLGEQVYDYFKDEFRFRLPSKSDAKQWKELDEIDVDDAC
uniref:THAP-type domain-containing protein n=1 Tax=Anopheles christyi TaxID=43041 RepID=A0A182JW78_9DIPT